MYKIALLAGYNNSWTSLMVAEKLRLSGNKPKIIIIAYPLTFKRLRTVIKNRGIESIKNYLFKIKKLNRKDLLVEQELKSIGINSPSIKKWAKKNNVKFIETNNINSKKAIEAIKTINPDFTAYTGGGIIKEKFIDAANNSIINAHSGKMPEIRGMNALEWSILLNIPTGITTHFIDKGIDTGNIIDWKEIKPMDGDNLDSLRQKIVLEGCNNLVSNIKKLILGKINPKKESNDKLSRQCFVVSPALEEIANLKLNP